MRGVDRPDVAAGELDLDADAPQLDRDALDLRALAHAHGRVEGRDGADGQHAALLDHDRVADRDGERAPRGLEALRPRDAARGRVPAHAEVVRAAGDVAPPGRSGRPVVAGREGGERLGREPLEVAAHEVAGDVDRLHALGPLVAQLGRGGVRVVRPRGVAVGGLEHVLVDGGVDGQLEQAQRVAERSGHAKAAVGAGTITSACHTLPVRGFGSGRPPD